MQKTRSRGLMALLILLIVLFLGAAGFLGWNFYDSYVDRSGWELDDGIYFYRDFHNRRVSGWQEIDGNRYYFDPEAGMQTGWLTQGNETRYLKTDGTLVTGWARVEGKQYHFDDTGAMSTGWVEDGGDLYYLSPGGTPLAGWQDIEGSRCYLTPEGRVTTGSAVIEDAVYLFGDDGRMLTGWQDGVYYLPEGPMATGWQDIDGKRYYFEDTGRPHVGWYTEGEYRYYFLEDGSAAVGPQTIDGREHFFSPKGIHVVLVNADHPIPDYWNPKIVTLTGDWHLIAEDARGALEKMLADCEAAGFDYGINSTYRSGENQKEIVKLRTEEYMAQGLTYTQAYAKTLETAAKPGTSEHEMGVAADLTGEEAKVWLGEHCWEYGFILRYPPDKQDVTGIINEPWHFRYVGKEVSMDMKDSGLCLEEYLGAGPVGG